MNKILVIIGPTAVGKTSIGIEAAKRLNGEIISADSRQLYRHLDIGTAKPPADTGIQHHLVDFLELDKRFNAVKFAELARETIQNIFTNSKIPVIVGGTGLYIKSLTSGFFKGVSSDKKTRAELNARHKAGEDLYAELEIVDPVAVKKIHPNNYVRIQRALEVYYITGKPISSFWKEGEHFKPGFESVIVGLTRLPRKALYERAEARVERMFADGWIKEVHDLLEKGVQPDCPGFEALGYGEIVKFLRGEMELPEAVLKIKQATRHYIKRQFTFFKKLEVAEWLDLERMSGKEAVGRIEKIWGKRE
ncbi:tRNA (adenosine(37)-N6)-dimethylallyltransferase MiaA [bacterium]|nr:tRNA (adenosine(37)-N6)-dimethylallyltransferase MiaA [bacterium]